MKSLEWCAGKSLHAIVKYRDFRATKHVASFMARPDVLGSQWIDDDD